MDIVKLIESKKKETTYFNNEKTLKRNVYWLEESDLNAIKEQLKISSIEVIEPEIVSPNIEGSKKLYLNSCNEYVSVFCKKQEMKFEGWVANKVGEIALCNDFYFNFSDIFFDINTDQPKGKIVDWYYSVIENQRYGVNYSSWVNTIKK